MGMSPFLATFCIWPLSWSVRIRITPLESPLNPIALRNLTIPAGKKRERDVASNNDPIETEIFELDIFRELLQK